jgi:ribosomal protein L37E
VLIASWSFRTANLARLDAARAGYSIVSPTGTPLAAQQAQAYRLLCRLCFERALATWSTACRACGGPVRRSALYLIGPIYGCTEGEAVIKVGSDRPYIASAVLGSRTPSLDWSQPPMRYSIGSLSKHRAARWLLRGLRRTPHEHQVTNALSSGD